jgi:hypothetical protein
MEPNRLRAEKVLNLVVTAPMAAAQHPLRKTVKIVTLQSL